MSSLHGKVAIVTGSSRGIGADIAKALAGAGAKVIINYVQDSAAAESVRRDISRTGGECRVVQADVSDPAQVQQLFETALDYFKQIDILVNNLGLASPGVVTVPADAM